MTQDMSDANIVTLYKNKGDMSDCDNYRGIPVISLVGKVIARAFLARLQKLAEHVYPESHRGFRAERSIIDRHGVLRATASGEMQRAANPSAHRLHRSDLTKNFDLVSRDGLLKLLQKIGCPSITLMSLTKSFHSDMKGPVQFDGSTSVLFNIVSGVKHACDLASTLFGIVFSLTLKYAFGSASEGIYFRTRSDGRIFNLARLTAKTKIRRFSSGTCFLQMMLLLWPIQRNTSRLFLIAFS